LIACCKVSKASGSDSEFIVAIMTVGVTVNMNH
jgi:hypothetical protein